MFSYVITIEKKKYKKNLVTFYNAVVSGHPAHLASFSNIFTGDKNLQAKHQKKKKSNNDRNKTTPDIQFTLT